METEAFKKYKREIHPTVVKLDILTFCFLLSGLWLLDAYSSFDPWLKWTFRIVTAMLIGTVITFGALYLTFKVMHRKHI